VIIETKTAYLQLLIVKKTMMKKVFIAGATGWVGKELSKNHMCPK